MKVLFAYFLIIGSSVIIRVTNGFVLVKIVPASTTLEPIRVPTVHPKYSPSTNAPNFYRRSSFSSSLCYRPLDQNDDDATLLKVQSRLPPNFDARAALSLNDDNDDGDTPKDGYPSSISSNRPPPVLTSTTALNTQFILALLINQALILGIASLLSAIVLLLTQGPGFISQLPQILHWEGLSDTTSSTTSPLAGLFDFTPTPQRIFYGVVGSIPLLINNFWIEQSDRRIFANINFSTITMVMTLFGRRSQPDPTFLPNRLKGRTFPTTTWPQALVASIALAGMTGFCEEIVFRRQVAAVLGTTFFFNQNNIGWIVLAQAFLFALGHIQPNASNSRGENAVLVGLQFLNGIGFGTIYLWSGGDLVPCMIAHALYDFIDFFKTWLDANGQLEYAERMWKTDLSPSDRTEVEQILRRIGMSMDDTQYKRLRRLFYTFDFDKNQTLSRSEVRKGIAYMAVERAGTPPPTEQVDYVFDQVKKSGSERLSFPDFLNLIMQSGGVGKSRTQKMSMG